METCRGVLFVAFRTTVEVCGSLPNDAHWIKDIPSAYHPPPRPSHTAYTNIVAIYWIVHAHKLQVVAAQISKTQVSSAKKKNVRIPCVVRLSFRTPNTSHTSVTSMLLSVKTAFLSQSGCFLINVKDLWQLNVCQFETTPVEPRPKPATKWSPMDEVLGFLPMNTCFFLVCLCR